MGTFHFLLCTVTGLYVIIVILALALFGFGMWYWAKHGYARNGEKHIIPPNSPNSMDHGEEEGNLDLNTGDNLSGMEGTNAIGPGPGATNDNVVPMDNNAQVGDMDVDDIVNMHDDDIVIQEIETLKGPEDNIDDMDIAIETMG